MESKLIRITSAVVVASLFVLSASPVWSDDVATKSWQCSSQAFEREIQLFAWDASCPDSEDRAAGPYACRVIYTKNGKSQLLWVARNNPDYCEPKARALVVKLQNSGFECAFTDHSATERCDPGSVVQSPPVAEIPVIEDSPPVAEIPVIEDSPPPTEMPVQETSPPVAEAPVQEPSAPVAEIPVKETSPPVAAIPAEETSPPLAPEPAREDVASQNVDAGLRGLLEKHYQEDYLDALIEAIPRGFRAQPASTVVLSTDGANLHLAPPNHFVKTMSDNSYVLVNTRLLQQGQTTSFVNFGFHVRDGRYQFLGYATAHSVRDATVMNADGDRVVLSILLPDVKERRTKIIPWHRNVYGNSRDAPLSRSKPN